MAIVAPPPKFTAYTLDVDGYVVPLVGGKLYSYVPGTTTPKNTYTDSTLGTANANPVVLDANGQANVWFDGATKLVLKDSSDVTQWTVDALTDLSKSGILTDTTLSGSLTISSTSVTWSNNPTHTGNHTFTNNVTVNGTSALNGPTTIGNAAPDTLAIAPDAITWSNNPTHSGNHTWSGEQVFESTVSFTSATPFSTTFVGLAVCAIKTATTARSSTTTLADDPHLSKSLSVGSWDVELFIPLWGTTSGAGGFKFALTFSGTSSASSTAFSTHGLINNAAATLVSTYSTTSSQAYSTIVTGSGSTAADWLCIKGVIVVTAPGNLTLQWAQNSSNSNAANVGIGAFLKATRLA